MWGCVLLLSATRFNPPFALTALASRSYLTLCSSSDRECGQIPVLKQINCMQFVWEEYSQNFMGFYPSIKITTFIRPCIANMIPNYNQQDTTFLDLFISTDAVHVSGDSSPRHQEHITVHTSSGIVKQYCCLLLSWMRWNSSTIAASSGIG